MLKSRLRNETRKCRREINVKLWVLLTEVHGFGEFVVYAFSGLWNGLDVDSLKGKYFEGTVQLSSIGLFFCVLGDEVCVSIRV